MKEAVERINKAIEEQESIVIFGDYDADGVTSTSVLLHTLKERSAIVDFYIQIDLKKAMGLMNRHFDISRSKEHRLSSRSIQALLL